METAVPKKVGTIKLTKEEIAKEREIRRIVECTNFMLDLVHKHGKLIKKPPHIPYKPPTEKELLERRKSGMYNMRLLPKSENPKKGRKAPC